MSAITVAELLDREAIRDCLYRYCRGIDRVDEESLRSAYWPDGLDTHGSFSGTAAAFVDWVMPILRRNVQTTHALTNVTFRIAGDLAGVETYFSAYERFSNRTGVEKDRVVAGRYLDRFERREGEWRILERMVVIDWFRAAQVAVDTAAGIYGTGPEPAMGAHAPDDLSYAFFDQIRPADPR